MTTDSPDAAAVDRGPVETWISGWYYDMPRAIHAKMLAEAKREDDKLRTALKQAREEGRAEGVRGGQAALPCEMMRYVQGKGYQDCETLIKRPDPAHRQNAPIDNEPWWCRACSARIAINALAEARAQEDGERQSG